MQTACPADARVVDQDVQALEVAQTGRDEGSGLGFLAHIDDPHVHLGRTELAASLGHRVEAVEATGAQLQAGARPGERIGGRLSNPARRAGDHDHRPL